MMASIRSLLTLAHETKAWRLEANAARDQGDWPRAARLYTRYLTRVPARGDIWVQLGHAQKEAGDKVSERRSYERAREVSPWYADAHFQLGHLLNSTGET